MSIRKWALIAGLLNGVLIWMGEHVKEQAQRKRKKKLKKLRKKQQRAGQPVQQPDDHVQRH